MIDISVFYKTYIGSKPIIKNFKIRRVYSSFKDNIWGVDLADM